VSASQEEISSVELVMPVIHEVFFCSQYPGTAVFDCHKTKCKRSGTGFRYLNSAFWNTGTLCAGVTRVWCASHIGLAHVTGACRASCL
jgi:hypothetical protein